MELKVWVDGYQRLICGIHRQTTCQEVIYALAHATGKTGRFVLAERWRTSERSLAPHDKPLELLTKWGEYANDVQLVLRCLPERSVSCGPGKVPSDAGQQGLMRPSTLAIPQQERQENNSGGCLVCFEMLIFFAFYLVEHS